MQSTIGSISKRSKKIAVPIGWMLAPSSRYWYVGYFEPNAGKISDFARGLAATDPVKFGRQAPTAPGGFFPGSDLRVFRRGVVHSLPSASGSNMWHYPRPPGLPASFIKPQTMCRPDALILHDKLDANRVS
jgi:hypothetical protein